MRIDIYKKKNERNSWLIVKTGDPMPMKYVMQRPRPYWGRPDPHDFEDSDIPQFDEDKCNEIRLALQTEDHYIVDVSRTIVLGEEKVVKIE